MTVFVQFDYFIVSNKGNIHQSPQDTKHSLVLSPWRVVLDAGPVEVIRCV